MDADWLRALLDQGGVAAVAGFSIYALVRVYNDRLEAERKHAEAQRALDQKTTEEMRLMWEQTRALAVESNRLISAFMERFQVTQQPAASKPKKRTVIRVHETNGSEHKSGD